MKYCSSCKYKLDARRIEALINFSAGLAFFVISILICVFADNRIAPLGVLCVTLPTSCLMLFLPVLWTPHPTITQAKCSKCNLLNGIEEFVIRPKETKKIFKITIDIHIGRVVTKRSIKKKLLDKF